MLSEAELQQLITTFEYAAVPCDDDVAVFVADLRKILAGYVCRSSSLAKGCCVPWVHQEGPA